MDLVGKLLPFLPKITRSFSVEMPKVAQQMSYVKHLPNQSLTHNSLNEPIFGPLSTFFRTMFLFLLFSSLTTFRVTQTVFYRRFGKIDGENL